jgi:hypothetical protein
MNPTAWSRRRFLVAALSLSGAAATQGTALLVGAQAWASDGAVRAALVRVARLLYPHDALDDATYAEVLDQAMAQVADEAPFDALLWEAEQALDGESGGTFLDASPEAQIAALQAIDQEAYWMPIQFAVAGHLYSHPKAWAMMGYEGPSWQHGGWIDRGAGDNDWLPEGGS